MTTVPHPTLGAFHRAAASPARMAALFREVAEALAALEVDIGGHPLVSDQPIVALAGDLDVPGLLERALARVARNPPRPRYRSRRADDGTGDRPLLPRQGHGSGGEPAAVRIARILAEHDETPGEPPGEGAETRTGRGTMPAPRRPSASRDADAGERASGWRFDRAAAQDGPRARPRSADAARALDHAVGRAGAEDAALISELLAEGRLGEASLATAAARLAGEPGPAPAAPDTGSGRLLQRLESLVTTIERRRAAHGSDRRRPGWDDAGDRVQPQAVSFRSGTATKGALRRLAIEGGADIRPLAAPAHPAPAGSGAARAAPPPVPDLARESDADLSRRLADILRREAERYGIDTDGAER